MFSLFRKSESFSVECPEGKCPSDDRRTDHASVIANEGDHQSAAVPTVNEVTSSPDASALQASASMLASDDVSSSSRSIAGDEELKSRASLEDDSLEAEADAGAEMPSEKAPFVMDGVDVLDELPPGVSSVVARRKLRGKRLVKREGPGCRKDITPAQRLLLLDTWQRSGLPAGDFAALVGISKHTLYAWKKNFSEQGPEGLLDQPRGVRSGRRLPELTKRTILMLKESHPEWGCERISDMLARGPALPASASTVARVLHEAGYELEESVTRPHRDCPRRFERAKPNQLWQTDLFTFVLKRQNRRLYLVAFMDDHSRFLVSYGLHASCSTGLVIEVLEAAISAYGPPEEILTDNGPQYVTWRGKSKFTKHLEKRGIRQIVARPRRPQTLGKIERFWGSLWREFLETVVFTDLAEARTRIGLFIDYYNFQRTHRGLEGLVPADRFFGAASDVAKTLKARVAANALELARHGETRQPFYVTGQMEGQSFSVHAEGPRLILTRPGQARQEIELAGPAAPSADPVLNPTDGTVASSVESAHSLPTPICPDGSVGLGSQLDEPLGPGESPLDAWLKDGGRATFVDGISDPSGAQDGGDA